jgi:hypothetical protein
MFWRKMKKIMALIYNDTSTKNKNDINQSNTIHSNGNKKEDISSINELNLTVDELEYIFNLIKKSNFSGTELDMLYRIVHKLQNQYILLKK